MSHFISLTKLCSTASFTRAPHYSNLSFTYVEDEQLFHDSKKVVGYIWIQQRFRTSKFPSCHTLSRISLEAITTLVFKYV